MGNRKVFFGFGIFFALSFCGMIFVTYMAGSEEFNYNSLLMLAMAVLSFSQYIVFPHVEAKDERAKEIRSKALYYTTIIVLSSLSIFSILLAMNPTFLTATNLLNIIIILFIVTQSASLVFVSRRI
jgi:hypothetical protein